MALPAADSLAEFRVQSGGMSAEYGRTVGGVINYSTRSGGNEWHGNLFEFHRSTATNARLAIPATAAKPNNVYNQFGGSFSGPVRVPRF
jgi:outer membrane receptor for Fe3+-dicitrate